MANVRRASRDIFAETDKPSHGFIGLLKMILFQPRQFFRVLDSVSTAQLIMMAVLLLTLISLSAVQQSAPANIAVDPSMEAEMMSSVQSDPSQIWMTGLTAAGSQVIYWLVLAIVLSEVSLFNGKAPRLGCNLKIVVWASVPFALMAGLQTLFVMGGGRVGEAGLSGLLGEWDAYHSMNNYLQMAVYAFASRLNLFWFWSLALLYLGAREGLKGKRFAVGLVLAMWVAMLTFAFAFQQYQATKPVPNDYETAPYQVETYPEEEMPADTEFISEPIGEDF